MYIQKKYQTRQRRLVEQLLRKCDRCLSADDIYTMLSESGENVGRTTVYRSLDHLAEQGCVSKFLSPDGSGALYRLAGEKCSGENHIHLKCTACGGVTHLDCCCIKELSDRLLFDHGFSIDTRQTVIFGKCGKCLEKL